MNEVEDIVRGAVTKILTDRDLLVAFDGDGREAYLDGLPFR
jgi:hypothetical protein